jgi:hypothetical protein
MPEPHHKVKPADDVFDPVDTPHGPQHGQVDEAAGGADSSPQEDEPTGHRLDEPKPPPGTNQPPRKE